MSSADMEGSARMSGARQLARYPATPPEVSSDGLMVRHAVQTMKKYEPDEFAALMAFVEQRKPSGRSWR